MGKRSNRKLISYLPLVFLVTFLVAVAPVLLVLWLRLSGVVTSVWAGTVIGVVVAFGLAYAGGAWWRTRTHSRDVLFSDLMLWGWMQRWYSERRLRGASDLLGLRTGAPKAIAAGGLSNEQTADLLTQLSSGLESRDPYTHGHSRRVARHASNIAKRMGMSREEIAKIRAAGAMHDVGKVETPTAVLHKEGKLTDEEFAIIKRHPVDGASMVATLKDDELTRMVRHHHERLDGTGYPDRLSGEAIPIGARIIAVADTFDAITSTRPYRQAHAHKGALDILAAEAGTQLDPDAVRAFCACYSGRRPLAIWTVLVNARPRLAGLLGGGLGAASAGTVGSAMATAATAAAVGSIALGPLVTPTPDASRALGSSPAPSGAQSQSRQAAPIADARPLPPSVARRDDGGRRAPRARVDRVSPAAPREDSPQREVESQGEGRGTPKDKERGKAEQKGKTKPKENGNARDRAEARPGPKRKGADRGTDKDRGKGNPRSRDPGPERGKGQPATPPEPNRSPGNDEIDPGAPHLPPGLGGELVPGAPPVDPRPPR